MFFFQLQLSVHGKKNPIQFTSLLCFNSFIHESPSCQLIVVTLFLQCRHKVTEMLWSGGADSRLSNCSVFVSDSSGAFYYNQSFWTFGSTYTEEYWASSPLQKKKKVKCKKEMLKNRNPNFWILFFFF